MKTYDFTLESHLWTKEDIECPYELLAWLTDLAHIDYFQEQIRNYCWYLLSDKMYDKTKASEVIFDLTVLQSLFKASYRIFLNPNDFRAKELIVSDVSEEDLQEMKYISEQEFKNPYLVFESIFEQFALDTITNSFFNLVLATMANTASNKEYDNAVSMLVYHRLLEACLLIQVRDTASYR
ncbi:hypothetical protein [Myroides injenensis]|uniref:hypothetical protein n=1 Tax=Myroides injenensis TaxID=1183151 RepID=UPI00028832C9|nr:hypothetical protein [Myroides injenensis]